MNHPRNPVTLAFSVLFLLLDMPGYTAGFQFSYPAGPGLKGETRTYNTRRIISEKPRIDGVLNDACWLEGEWSGDYRQQLPTEGAPPSQKTEMKILYDDENIYVAIRAYDNEPWKTDRQMVRRDQFAGDIVGINFDSYFDHRTGFEFNLTASGCKIDLILTNDGWDTNWNPVWNGKVGQEDSAWVAEMQIPLSQLRYGNQEVQVWGLHSWRWINRNKEEDQWNLIPRDNAGPLYYFGELHGLVDLPKVSRVEFMPYGLAKFRKYPPQASNPFADGHDPSASFGLDGKFGMGSNFTVDYTINPDFGQVEADPSVLNLTAFETYFEEKRPFFIEGKNILDFTISENQLLYSRRIGHEPTYEPETGEDEYSHKPENTSILGALKLTGKTEKGLSVGIMESLTAAEYVKLDSPEGEEKLVSEPLTNYFAGRLQKDIHKGNSMIGGMITSTYRDLQPHHLDFMNRSAITGGLDFRQYFANRTFCLDLKTLASTIHGSARAITGLQQESSRYYQRPDAPHLSLDTMATTLSGQGGSLELRKEANGKWRYGIGTHWRSPGLELNDLGFQSMADDLIEGQMIAYVENEPKGIFRSYELLLNQMNEWTFGGEYLGSVWNLETEFDFKNKWGLHAEWNREGKSLDISLLRGGPAVYSFGTISQYYYMNTDDSRKFSLSWGFENESSDDHQSRRNKILSGLVWKVTNSLQLSASTSYDNVQAEYQYVPNPVLADQGRFLLGRLRRETYEIIFRLNYTITPVFTIQYYGSPYITMGSYSSFKTLDDEDSRDPGRVFRAFGENELVYDETSRTYSLYDGIHPEPELSFENPDFNFRQFRSNLVARWEYKPGSVLYLVWTHNRTSSEAVTNHAFDYNMNGLFSEPAENIFLLKFSYWFSR
jgi:hypothetical protein